MSRSHVRYLVQGLSTSWLLSAVLSASSAAAAEPANVENLVGQPADIAASAYQYRADRKADENPPESWLPLMWYAGQPLNRPVDRQAAAIRQALCGLLWEEIRPVKTLVLTWPADAKRRPPPEDLTVTTLNARCSASSWWNNLAAAEQTVKPTVSGDGGTYTYDLRKDTCGIVVSVAKGRSVADYDVPTVQVLTAETWKKMEVEIEWGFDPASAAKDYSGRIETYDGRITDLHPLDGDGTTATAGASGWRSAQATPVGSPKVSPLPLGEGPVVRGSRTGSQDRPASSANSPHPSPLPKGEGTARDGSSPPAKGEGTARARRGVKLTLLYIGSSKWRRVQPFTSQADDVARTIVTLWSKAGNFSFLAADLESGPILAPEYGFFIRRTSELAPARDARAAMVPLDQRMSSIAGIADLVGWGSDACPWFGGNPTDKPVSASGITIPAHRLAMHPGADRNVVLSWRSPIEGKVRISGGVAHAQSGGDGIEWSVVRTTKANRRSLLRGLTNGSGSQAFPAEKDAARLSGIAVEPGDLLSLVIGPKGTHVCDMTVIDFVVSEEGGQGRVWNATADVVKTLHAGNPHADGQGNGEVWKFCCESLSAVSEPPFSLASSATSAAEFIQELKAKNLRTIRQRVRGHSEQTWQGAVMAMRGGNLPAHPKPPAGGEPPMRVQLPCERLTAQWNLGVWHLTRHCEKNPKNGRLWFADYPYGILAEETYMVLNVLDLMGAHKAAEDGFDQWVSLPMDPRSGPGHNPDALPDRPTGLFSDGHGCMTHAVGCPGIGGHMDGVHAFGAGSIGWALTEHYWLTGDRKWLEAAAPRIRANVEWVQRQRQLLAKAVPGGERLWCKGLMPPLQATPDAGGLWMQFYEVEAYYYAFLSRMAATLSEIDPAAGGKLAAEAEAYRRDLLTAVDRSIALSPVVPVRDGTYHSVIPCACYVRGLGTGAWGWQRDGSGSHVGPLYWETVQTAAGLISLAGLLSPKDVRVQGYLDVLEDRLLLENPYVGNRNWFNAGWQYQEGLERTSNMHLAADDVPAFLRSFLNAYAVDILPGEGYVFNEHAVHGPPDKIFEEAAFLERLRDLLVWEEDDSLWLARATPRAWLEQGKSISVKHAPTHFGNVDYEIVSDADNGRIAATVNMPSRNPPKSVLLRLRHPKALPIKSVAVNGQPWRDFDAGGEVICLHGLKGQVKVEAVY